MARSKADMQRLIAQRDQMLREIDALKNKVAGLEMAIALLENEGANARTFNAKHSVKAVLLDLLREVAANGLNAATAVEMANRKGITLHSGSVSSTLSRFKKDNVVDFDGDRYRLPSAKSIYDVPPPPSNVAPWPKAAS